jgi:hypothetical protein
MTTTIVKAVEHSTAVTHATRIEHVSKLPLPKTSSALVGAGARNARGIERGHSNRCGVHDRAWPAEEGGAAAAE